MRVSDGDLTFSLPGSEPEWPRIAVRSLRFSSILISKCFNAGISTAMLKQLWVFNCKLLTLNGKRARIQEKIFQLL